MSAQSDRLLYRLDWPLVAISVLVLLGCLFYAFAYAFLSPYSGITLDTGDAGWIVNHIDPCNAHPGWCSTDQGNLQLGDQLIAIGNLTFEEYRQDRRRVRFGGYNPGDSVPITLIDNGERRIIHWIMPTVTPANRFERLGSLLFCLPFWLAGTVVLLFLRSRGIRWRLLISFYYLTAIWLAAGMVSSSQVAASSLVLHAVSWLLVPIYLHLHFLIPSPFLGRFPRYAFVSLYAMAIFLATLELFQLLPYSAYTMGVLLAMAGSLGLLTLRLFDKSSLSALPAVRLMLVGVGLTFGPGLTLWLIPGLLGYSVPSALATNIAILALPTLPLFYIYAIYKRHLGELEFRANRLLGGHSFFLLFATIFALIFSISRQWASGPESTFLVNLAITLVFVMSAPALHIRFQRLVDRLAYGGKHDPDAVLGVLARHLPLAFERASLVQLLSDEIVPSLLIRQSALVLLENGDVELLYAQDIGPHEAPESPRQVEQLLAKAGQYRPPMAEAAEARDINPGGDRFDWVRLAIPLITREHSIGVWLFGRRDPDDYYPRRDIELLTTLASQIAVTIENTRLFEQVRTGRDQLQDLSRRLLHIQEAERRYIANELHDEIGQNLTGIKLNLDSAVGISEHALPEAEMLHRSKTLVDELIDKVHDLSLDLRPPTLDDLGLLPTLLWHIQRYKAQTKVEIDFKHRGLGPRFPATVEITAYRIVQEAITNVARHANVNKAKVRVWFDSRDNEIYIQVEDQGNGFDYQAVLATGKASGLIGMRERAVLLGGQLEIISTLGRGTRLEASLPLEEWLERRQHER
ncbi:MAG: GAF domain-containing sensor histidine kinase [Anaerolineales bacterium]|nr:GAF domain-containing sensor histidine kinase [Anaerolineales bacterium]